MNHPLNPARRRLLVAGAVAAGGTFAFGIERAASATPRHLPPQTDRTPGMTESTIVTKDGAQIYCKDLGDGPVVTSSHGWPLKADAWDGPMHVLARNGFRVVAHDRRGHGRSSQSSSNCYAGASHGLTATLQDQVNANLLAVLRS